MKVIVALKGGLGNQMFEYSAAYALAKRNHAELVLDISAFTNPREWGYALGPFGLTEVTQSADVQPWERGGIVDRVLRRASRKLGLRRRGIPVRYENDLGFDAGMLLQSAPVWLEGYWQSWRYFDDCAQAIRERFGKPGELCDASRRVLDAIIKSDAICVHVRRGDYVTNPAANRFHGLCGLDYYARGFEEVASGLEAPHCFVFSDDPRWVRENMKLPAPMHVVDVNGTDQAHQDLWLMAACRNFIIANSSLSWWGAWLGRHPEKKVVAPKRWFQGSDRDTSDLVPPDWRRL